MGASVLEQIGYERITVVEDGYEGWATAFGPAGCSR
jgi:rhodanese-related sulfurtransferase